MNPQFSFENLDVYKRALVFSKKILTLTKEVKGQYSWCDQLNRAATSITLTLEQACLLLNGGIVATLYLSQKNLFKKYVAEGGGKASIKIPLILSFLLAFSYAGVRLGVEFYHQSKTSDILQDFQEKAALIQMINDRKYAAAEPLLIKYEGVHPEDSDTYWNLAVLYLQTDRPQLALRQLEQLKQIDPAYEGLEDYMKTIRGYVNNPGSYEEEKKLTKLLDEIDSQIETQKFDLAEKSLLDYKKLHPDDERIIIKLADVYTKTDRLEKARIEMEEYLKKHPQALEATEFLKEIQRKMVSPKNWKKIKQ